MLYFALKYGIHIQYNKDFPALCSILKAETSDKNFLVRNLSPNDFSTKSIAMDLYTTSSILKCTRYYIHIL